MNAKKRSCGRDSEVPRDVTRPHLQLVSLNRPDVVSEKVHRLVLEIEAHGKSADYGELDLAMRVKELRALIDGGAAGPIKWFEWAPKNVRLSIDWLTRLQTVAESDNPRAALDAMRKDGAQRARRYRDRKARREIVKDPTRRKIRNWALAAEQSEIDQFWSMIEARKHAARLKSR